MRGTFKPTLALMCGRSLAFAGTFLIPVVLVRVFDQAQFGTYKQFFLIWFTLHAISQFGMAESLIYFLPAAPRQAGKFVANSLLCLAAAGVLCLGLLLTTAPTIAAWLGNGALTGYMGLTGVFVALTLPAAILEIVRIARGQYVRAAATYAASDLLRAACLILPALLTRRLEWVLVGAVGFACIRLGASLSYAGREFRGALRPDAAVLRAQLAYALPFAAAVLIEIVQSNFHNYAVSHTFGAASFAIYSVGCLNIPLVDLAASSASNVMMVRMGEAIGPGRDRERLTLWHDTTRRLALLLVPLVGLLLVSARELVVILFTEAYLSSVPVFLIWTCGILLAAVNTDGVLRVYADTRFLVALNAVRLAVNVALLVWLMRVLHLPGAALATVLATALAKVGALVRVRRLLGTSLARLLPWRSLARIAAVTAVAALAALIFKTLLAAPPLPVLVGTAFVYSVTLLGLVLRFDLLTSEERLVLYAWLRKLSVGASQSVGLART